MDQLALADFIERGELNRHLRRMRPIYRRRRDALLAAMARSLPGLEPVGASAGLHVLAWLPDDVDERGLIDGAGAAGIGLTGVTWCCLARPPRRGIVRCASGAHLTRSDHRPMNSGTATRHRWRTTHRHRGDPK